MSAPGSITELVKSYAFELEGHKCKYKYKYGGINSPCFKYAMEFVFERFGDPIPVEEKEDDFFPKTEDEEALHPPQVLVSVKSIDRGRQERELFRRLADGKTCPYVIRLLKYEELVCCICYTSIHPFVSHRFTCMCRMLNDKGK